MSRIPLLNAEAFAVLLDQLSRNFCSNARNRLFALFVQLLDFFNFHLDLRCLD